MATVYALWEMPRLVASFFGSGLLLGKLRGSDGGSGTVGSLLALAIAFLAPVWSGRALALALTLVIGYWAVTRLRMGDRDPGWVVIDEAAGTFLATLGLGWPATLVAFVVFRVADIFKGRFPGVAAAERIGGPAGIMSDDLVAGLYGLAAGWLAQALTT